jgi:hypothetical protein
MDSERNVPLHKKNQKSLGQYKGAFRKRFLEAPQHTSPDYGLSIQMSMIFSSLVCTFGRRVPEPAQFSSAWTLALVKGGLCCNNFAGHKMLGRNTGKEPHC